MKSQKYMNEMQKDFFWNKWSHLFLVVTLCVGLICGFCSIYELEYFGALWRPPLTFWAFFFVLWLLVWNSDPMDALKLLFLFFLSYWVAFFIGSFAFTSMMTLGALLTFGSVTWVLKLKRPSVLLLAGLLLLLFGFIIDINLDFFDSLFSGCEWCQRHRTSDSIGEVGKFTILIWQTISFAAISLQMYSEKLRRKAIRDTVEGDRSDDSDKTTIHP